MGIFFKRNDFKVDYKKGPHDDYKALIEKLDEDTKRKFDRRRALIMTVVLGVVVLGVIILAVTGIGVNKTQSAGNILGGEEAAVINCLGDSVTLGTTEASWPESMKKELESKLGKTVTVHNYADSKGKAANTTYKTMNETPNIAILMYTYENCLAGEDPEGILQANIDGLSEMLILTYLVNYPYSKSAKNAAAAKQANQYISKAATEKSLLLLDANAYFNNLVSNLGYTEEDLYSEDGIHLTDKGYELLGQFVADGLISDAGLE